MHNVIIDLIFNYMPTVSEFGPVGQPMCITVQHITVIVIEFRLHIGDNLVKLPLTVHNGKLLSHLCHILIVALQSKFVLPLCSFWSERR